MLRGKAARRWLWITPVPDDDIIWKKTLNLKPCRQIECTLNQHIFCLDNGERLNKWQFYYQGNKISADIKDETFYGKIDSGAKFSKGDKLIADIEIKQTFDDSIQSYINKEYSVIKIKQRIPRDEQTNIF